MFINRCIPVWSDSINDNLNLVPLASTGYLSCCRFLDDSQIVTSSGDTTWWVACRALCAGEESQQDLKEEEPIVTDGFSFLLITVRCGTSKLPSRPPRSPGTRETWWVFPLVLTWGLLCPALAMHLPNYGTSVTACAGSPSQGTSPILTLSA